jgi:hypothetical protein
MRSGTADDPLSEAALGQAELGGEVGAAEPAAGDLADVELPDVGFAFEVVPGSPVSGELDGDPGPEAVAVIALPSVAAPRSLRLAAVNLVDGRAIPLASYELAPGTRVQSLAIVKREVIAELVVAPSGDAAGAAPVTEPLHWRPLESAPARHRP